MVKDPEAEYELIQGRKSWEVRTYHKHGEMRVMAAASWHPEAEAKRLYAYLTGSPEAPTRNERNYAWRMKAVPKKFGGRALWGGLKAQFVNEQAYLRYIATVTCNPKRFRKRMKKYEGECPLEVK